MSFLTLRPLRRRTALLCIGLVLCFAARNVAMTTEGMQHTLHIGHEPSEVAGAVTHCATSEALCEPTGDKSPSHVHSTTDASARAEGHVSELIAPVEFVIARFDLRGQIPSHGRGQIAPDRPPKA